MQIRVVPDQPWSVAADVLAVPVFAGDLADADGEALAELDRRLGGAIGEYRRLGEVSSELFRRVMLHGQDLGAPWLLAVGAGDAAAFDRRTAYRFAAAIERRLAGLHVSRLAVWLPSSVVTSGATTTGEAAEAPMSAADLVMLVARGVTEGSYDPATIYRESYDEAPAALDELVIVVRGADVAALQAAAERGAVIGEGARVARDLANRASNDVNPEVLADAATDLAKAHGLAIDVIGPERATEMGMGLFMAVGRGSDNPPRLIVLRNGGDGEHDARGRLLALVGKGVTFDSGGISIKPSDRMEEMKMDKTGACTVIAAIVTAKRLAPDLPLLALAPAVENMPGPHSTRPGDIVKALNGKVVEVQNTDAEGRLILGDALTYAERLGATHLIDAATLTGAVERAFGKQVTGAFGTPQGWYDTVVAAGARQGERYWQIPLVDDYVRDMESWYADFQNSGPADGSLVKSGLFLREFVTRPWVHLDIAGTAYMRRPMPWAPRGATGVSHATMVELALEGANPA
ncbi:MAG: aminopeptidase [Chloroflexi bacterium]|nr:aminopeptidase [Chloroflexota bacterium]